MDRYNELVCRGIFLIIECRGNNLGKLGTKMRWKLVKMLNYIVLSLYTTIIGRFALLDEEDSRIMCKKIYDLMLKTR
ncbi:hypothetical protein K435DRAFT_95373 [Dendrothele bispora CBS 962.96]|uniref:Uncharacterized protein n=1 Tax=Dendrothele bispora (strain CBS 962.96) TaxID=1314807 RepID=A0A4S8M432_DENBC|nr:hypothetical protein K435DRAFT_95373 [Dendrothele bispora CBS 962.96]